MLVDECLQCFGERAVPADSDGDAWVGGLFVGGVAAAVYVLWAWWSKGQSSALDALVHAAIVGVVLMLLVGLIPQNGFIRQFFGGLFGVGIDDFKKHQAQHRDSPDAVYVEVSVADGRGWTATWPAWGETDEDASQAVLTMLRKIGKGHRSSIEVVGVEAIDSEDSEPGD